jgi:hypothetical protein
VEETQFSASLRARTGGTTVIGLPQLVVEGTGFFDVGPRRFQAG